jgi:Glucose / Sorbosone dehydrogenase
MGLAFDPMENSSEPFLYFTSNDFYHKDTTSSSGLAINGRVSRIKITSSGFGPVVDIITGLPVSDHDHGNNAIVFGNNGELYIANGGNTNGGRPGRLSGSTIQQDNYLSGSIIVARMSSPNFNGRIQYTAPNAGMIVNRLTNGIDVFGHGVRNPFGVTLHSNGRLYASDNGPNRNYGQMSTGCDETNVRADQFHADRIHHIVEGNYYGYPNMVRAKLLNDPRQCVYRKPDHEPVAGFSPPIAIIPSALTGIAEYHANHFNGKLRGNMIVVKYQAGLFRIILTPDGTGTIAASRQGISMNLGQDGTDITMSPHGIMIEARRPSSKLIFHRPIEPATTSIKIYSVFPVRGPLLGRIISVYGQNFVAGQILVSVGVTSAIAGGAIGAGTMAVCSNPSVVSSIQIDCLLPAGRETGLVDISVSKVNTNETVVLTNGYRYITGR